MKTKLIAVFLMLSMAVSLSGCFPNGKKVKKEDGEFVKISIEGLSDLPKHVDQTISEKLTINADVNIEVKNNFNVYTAKTFDCDIDKWCEIFFKDKKPTESRDEETMYFRDYGFANTAKYNPFPNRPNCHFLYDTQKFLDNDFVYFYQSAEDPNGTMCYNRDTILAKKEMDFMSSEAATGLIEEKMQQLGIATAGYKIFSMDYDYIKAQDQADLESYGSDSRLYNPHDKEDECYIIIPKIKLPNESTLTEVIYTYSGDSPDEKDITIFSGATLATVDNGGISNLELNGIYDVTGEKETEKIMDLDSALEIIKDKYSDSTKDVLIDNIELSYTPYLINKDEGTFELKPTWVFSVIREWQGEICRTVTLVDAVDGNVPKLINTLGLD